MRFDSEHERMQHPQARLIPKQVWKALFNSELSDNDCFLVQMKTSDLTGHLRTIQGHLTDIDSKRRALFAVALGHSDLTGEALLAIGRELGLSNEWVLSCACIIGNLRVVNLLATENLELIKTYDNLVYVAASHGQLQVMERLIELIPNSAQGMLKINGIMALDSAAENGYLAVVERLMRFAPNRMRLMIRIVGYKAFCKAAENGHLDVMECFLRFMPNQVKAMVQFETYQAFGSAACKGNLAVMERLIELISNRRQGFGATFHAAMKRLMALPHNDLQDMISARNYKAFQVAAGNGHLSVMKRLIELAPDKVRVMTSANNYAAFRYASSNNHLDNLDVINFLFQQNVSLFAYAEPHEEEFGEKYVHPFVIQNLTALRVARVAVEAENVNAVFDVTNLEQSKCCFYLLRNIIRRNDPALLDDIRFLTEIPSVKTLLHTAVTPNQSNELFRLALNKGNQAAAEILLTVPEVYNLAVQHDFYSREAQGGLDLNALAMDRESSMTALTLGEQKRLNAAIKLYRPIIRARGIESLMTELRDVLMARYQKSPARVNTDDRRIINLPATWDEWCELRETFSVNTRKQALEAYAKHKDHSAWRYLEKPNPWMAEDAPYVNRDTLGAYSTFEGYKPLIAMFFLGASDKNTLPCDGYTFETRLEHFIDELALIGRAHNWDKTRIRRDVSGHSVEEEYDDLKGDKPSCYSGVKRRLFQSVLGHPLLKILTMDDIKQELREVVREQFKQCITKHPSEAVKWKKGWDKVCETGLGDEALSGLNIPESDQVAFIEVLRIKYPSQFDGDPGFKLYIQDRFKLNELVSTHAARFGGEIDLTALLEPCVSRPQLSREKLVETRLLCGGHVMFKSAQPTLSSEDNKEQTPAENKRPDDLGTGRI